MVIKIINQLRERDYEKISDILSGNPVEEDHYPNCAYILSCASISPVEEVITNFISQDKENYSLFSAAYSANGRSSDAISKYVMGKIERDVKKKYDSNNVKKRVLSTKTPERDHYLFSILSEDSYTDIFGNYNDAFFKLYSGSPKPIEKDYMEPDAILMAELTETCVNSLYEAFNKKTDAELFMKLYTPLHMKERGSSCTDKVTIKQKSREIKKPLFDDIGGCEEAKMELALLAHGFQNPLDYEKWGMRFPRGILLYGPPGTGKTMLAMAMANECEATFIVKKCSDMVNKYFGESEKNIERAFDEAEKKAPSILMFDEINSIIPSRSSIDNHMQRLVNTMLSRMDGMEKTDGVVVMGTTNLLESLDPAIIRGGRFDKLIEVPLPDFDARKKIYQIHCYGKRIDDEINYDLLSRKSEGLSGADIEEILQKGLQSKLKKDIMDMNPGPLDTDDIMKSIEQYKKSRKMSSGRSEYHEYMYV